MLGYLSADIICSETLTVVRERSCELQGRDDVQGQISEHIFMPNEGIVFIFLQIFFATRTVLKIGQYINNSHHLVRKYAWVFVCGHYLFREANSFPRAKLEENCELRGTDNVEGQISEHIFAPNGGYCLHYPSNLYRNARNFENWEILGHLTCLDQSRAKRFDGL